MIILTSKIESHLYSQFELQLRTQLYLQLTSPINSHIITELKPWIWPQPTSHIASRLWALLCTQLKSIIND